MTLFLAGPSGVPSPVPTFVIQTVSQPGTPTWVTPVVAGIFVIAGAIIAFFSTRWSDRKRLQREDRRQWDKQILELYAAIFDSTKSLNDIWHSGRLSRKSRKAVLAEVAELTRIIQKSSGELTIIGPPKVSEAAQEVALQAQYLENNIQQHRAGKNAFRPVTSAAFELQAQTRLALRVSEVRQANLRHRFTSLY